MNKPTRNLTMPLVVALSFGTLGGPSAYAQNVQSLRGADVSAPERNSENFRVRPDGPPIQRDFVQQPPVIPHKVEGYEVSMNFNKCMDCHSWSRYQEFKATKVSLTHFKDRDGGELSNVSPRRYFCLQCHVSQTDARPLVDNTFKRADGLR